MDFHLPTNYCYNCVLNVFQLLLSVLNKTPIFIQMTSSLGTAQIRDKILPQIANYFVKIQKDAIFSPLILYQKNAGSKQVMLEEEWRMIIFQEQNFALVHSDSVLENQLDNFLFTSNILFTIEKVISVNFFLGCCREIRIQSESTDENQLISFLGDYSVSKIRDRYEYKQKIGSHSLYIWFSNWKVNKQWKCMHFNINNIL